MPLVYNVTIFLPINAGTLPNRSANQPKNRVPNKDPAKKIVCALGTFPEFSHTQPRWKFR